MVETGFVMPAKAGIHIHRLVFMDTGFRRYDRFKTARVSVVAGHPCSVPSVYSVVSLFSYAAAGLLFVIATNFSSVARALPLSIASAAICTPARKVAALPATSRAAALL